MRCCVRVGGRRAGRPGRRGRAVGRRGDPRPAALPGAADAKLPVLLLVTFRDDALAPADPLRRARRAGRASATRGGSTFRPCRRRRTPARRGPSYSPEELLRAHRRQPVLRRRGAQRHAVPRCRLRPATPCWPGPRGSATPPARPSTSPPSTPGGSTPHLVAARRRRPAIETLDELSRRADEAEGATLRFRHELARRAIESEVPPHRCGAGPPALLERWSSDDCDDDARLAYHAEAAGDPDLVRPVRTSGGPPGGPVGCAPRGVAQYERACGSHRTTVASCRALRRYAEVLALVDQWPAAAEARQDAIEIWHRLGEVRRERMPIRGVVYAGLALIGIAACRP